MPHFDITVCTQLPHSYRVARTYSLFNVTQEQASSHVVRVDVPFEDRSWRIGAVIGPSGSGKTTLGLQLLGRDAFHQGFVWNEQPIIDVIGPMLPFDDVTGALAAVGLGTVPSWLRPYSVLSMGERFRADLARLIVECETDIVLDEFTSVVDRQIAQIGAHAFSKAWRRKPSGRVVVLSCHYDVVDWLQPDWLLDTRTWAFSWRSLQRRPAIDLDIHETNWRAWPTFEPHHYLKLPRMVAATNYVAEHVGSGEPVAHVAVSTLSGLKTARLCRLVVMPEWQGAGVGMRFLEYVAERWLRGENRYSKPMTSIIHTSHPGLIAALARSSCWRLTSQQLGSKENKADVIRRMRAWDIRVHGSRRVGGGYGGHLRGVAGFRYVGRPA